MFSLFHTHFSLMCMGNQNLALLLFLKARMTPCGSKRNSNIFFLFLISNFLTKIWIIPSKDSVVFFSVCFEPSYEMLCLFFMFNASQCGCFSIDLWGWNYSSCCSFSDWDVKVWKLNARFSGLTKKAEVVVVEIKENEQVLHESDLGE